MEHIGEILRTAREDNFYTQKKVMELTGINRKTLSGYENSVAEPDLDTFARLLSPLAFFPFALRTKNAYSFPKI